jgi:hypothetical protein
MQLTNAATRRVALFTLFAKSIGLPIVPGSIESRQPPEPDTRAHGQWIDAFPENMLSEPDRQEAPDRPDETVSDTLDDEIEGVHPLRTRNEWPCRNDLRGVAVRRY